MITNPNSDNGSGDETPGTGDSVIDVTFTIDSQNTYEISPFIYGTNYFGDTQWDTAPYTLGRAGGNRWTAYNWENNASNSGSD